MGLKIALTYNLKRKIQNSGLPDDYYAEFDSEETIKSIANALRSGGNEVYLVEADKGLLGWFQNNKADIVFNIAEGLRGESRESQVPAILDFLNIPYTGSGVLVLSIALNKTLTKKLLEQAKISTPKYKLFDPSRSSRARGHPERSEGSLDISDADLRYPLIVKPNCEGSAKGISITNVVRNKTELTREVERIYRTYNQEILVEEFIEGKELTVGILGNGSPYVLPVLEIDFSSCKPSGEYFYTWKVKEFEKEVDETLGLTPIWHCPASLTEEENRKVIDVALRAHSVIGCVDFSRIDIRLGVDGVPYVLEVNPLPGLDPKDSNLPYIAKCAGLSYADLINKILELAVDRHKLKSQDLALEERSLR